MLPPIHAPLNPASEPPYTYDLWLEMMIKLVKQYGEACYSKGVDNTRFRADALHEQVEGSYRAAEAHMRRRLTG